MVVSSERSGYRHVYLYGLDGSLIRDLTPPDLEVRRLHSGVYVSGSTGRRQEQQLFRLDLDGGPATQVTTEPGWHDVTVSAEGNAYLDTYSTALKSPSVRLNGVELLRATVTQKPVANELLTIKTHDDVLLPARLFKPGDFDEQKKYPVILYTFSGPLAHVVKDAWGGWEMAWNRYMVNKGYLVLAVDVRGSGGYGHFFEEYIHYRFGAQETADLREVVSFLRRQKYVDGERLGIWGCDYGAHTVVHAMLQFPGGFKAGFAYSPITDWHKYDAYFTERYLGLPARRITEYDDSSALEDAKRMTGTLMAAACAGDPMIRREHLEALQKAMSEVKKPDVAKRFHVMSLNNGAYAEMLAAMTQFFEQTL
jgi:dipeptidyl-peptidase-4